jgi:hypothetical protein
VDSPWIDLKISVMTILSPPLPFEKATLSSLFYLISCRPESVAAIPLRAGSPNGGVEPPVQPMGRTGMIVARSAHVSQLAARPCGTHRMIFREKHGIISFGITSLKSLMELR